MKTPAKFHDEYTARASRDNFNIIDAGFVIHDALWILALALNNTMTMVSSGDIGRTNCSTVPGSLVNFENFTHTNSRMRCVIQWNLNNTNFSGVSVCLTYSLLSECMCNAELLMFM